MALDRGRLVGLWRRVTALSWPVMVEQVSRTSTPASRYGAGTIALSSQDTGSGATTNRDAAITQGVFVGALAGVPFVVFGLALSEAAIAVLGLWADRGSGTGG